MPFPDGETLRAAVEKQLHEGLEAMPGDWIATLPDGTEVEFRPGDEFEIVQSLPDEEWKNVPRDEPVERIYRFRVRVELVEVVDDPG